jgi:myo-inositol-1(or 4)-monophosphatase
MTPSEQDLLCAAIDAARAAASHAAANKARRGEVAQAFRYDVKLNLDAECQGIAERVLLDRFPDHAVLGEEDKEPRAAAHAPFEWVVDPIDGTVNFSHGMRFWCCSVAVRDAAGEVLAGAVYAPDIDELYTAGAQAPALCNGEPIAVSRIDRVEQAMVMSGMDRLDDPNKPPHSILNRLAHRAQKVRLMGCAALDLCRVARGEADAYFEAGVFDWDVAAAGLIVRRAGGMAHIVRRLARPHQLCFLASNGLIHAAMEEIVQLG